MAQKFVVDIAGTLTEVEALVSSAGAGDAGKVAAIGADGRFDPSLMPVGIGADTSVITTSEALSAGNWVNVWDSAGAFRVRKADGSTSGKWVDGFVLAAFGNGVPATVYFEGTNTQVSGQTPGSVFLSATPGIGGATALTGAGQVSQRIGVATSATAVNFERGTPVVRA